MIHNYKVILLVLISILFLSYSGGAMTEKQITFSALDQLKDADWDNLAKKKIYFAHMSVGINILEGVKDLQKEYPKLKIKIIESREPENLQPGTLVHSTVGKNFSPYDKMADYTTYLNAGLAKKIDVAALKFCYLDVLGATDIKAVFTEYTKVIDKLKEDFPDLTLVHFTVPLTKRETGPKSWIKRTMGRGIGVEENIRRQEYNALLVNKYNGVDPILDIATIESTFPDGKRSASKAGEKLYFSLVPEYTYDNGHLNEIGRKKVAEQFLLLLAKIN